MERQPELLAELAADPDWLVSMRAVDLLEKFAHTHPERVQPHRKLFPGSLADSDKWEIRLQVVRALPLLKWSAKERQRAVRILCRDIEHPQAFVRAWALGSLATMAGSDAALLPIVRRGLSALEASGRKSLQTRARHIRTRVQLLG